MLAILAAAAWTVCGCGGPTARRLNEEGATHYARSEYDKAESCFRKALELNPKFVKAYKNLALVLVKRKRYDEAARMLEKALTYNPEYAEAHINLSIILYHQKKIREAYEHAKEALELGFPVRMDYYDKLRMMVVAGEKGKEGGKP